MRELMSYLPENYLDSRETVAFQEALQPEVGVMWAARDDLLAQLDPWTAEWGLDYWEAALGLSNGQGLDLDVRRRAIVAKLQGRATTTPQVVRDMAETLLGVPVTVTEMFGEYTVLLATPAGYLPRLQAVRLRTQLRDVMPAHLDFQVVVPTAAYLPVTPRMGPRQGLAGPPAFRPGAAAAETYITPRMRWNFSTVTPPAAPQEGG